MQEEVTNKTVTLVIRTTKMTAGVLWKAVKAYLNSQGRQAKKRMKVQKKLSKKNLGKVKVKDLAAMDSGMTNIEITSKNIKSFERYARKYGINYALKKDKSKDPPVYMVFFKGRDKDAIHAAFRDFTAAEVRRANKTTIRKRLQKYRAVTAQRKRNRAKTKTRTQNRTR